jgi:hypothetical protein
MKLEATLLETITKKQVYESSFSDLVKKFDEKLLDFDPVKNAFEVAKYFMKGGHVSVTKSLLSDNKISQGWLREYTTKNGNRKIDFKGLYVFVHKTTPIYVGISKGVIGRIIQHVKGHSHNTSTLAYNIGLIRYEIQKEEKYIGGRKEFDFETDVTPAKEFLLQQKIAFLPISNNEEMYLFEIFCAMQLQCWLNKFETH